MIKRAALSTAGCGALLIALAASTSPVTGQSGGTVVGHVHYMGPTPVTPIIRMGADPRCNKLYAGKRPTLPTFVVGADGAMANVLVDIEGSFPATPVPTTPVVLNQKDCMYEPRVLGARIGQTLQVTNQDPTVHNVHSLSKAGNDFNTTQLIKGPPFEYKLKAGEILRVTCDNHTWMTAYIAVVDNPYFAVTTADGSFTIANVPAGKQTIRVWHEVMGWRTQTIDVQAGKSTTVDFTYMPAQKPAAGAAVPVHELIVRADVLP
jgi:plastocyanin